jgi:hypothetical protein
MMRVIILLLTLHVLGVSSVMSLKKKVADLCGRGLYVVGMLGRDKQTERGLGGGFVQVGGDSRRQGGRCRKTLKGETNVLELGIC